MPDFPADMTVDHLFSLYRTSGRPRYLAGVFDRTAPELLRLAAHLARDNVRVLSHGEELSLEVTRAICEAWMISDPLQPEPALVLARKLLKVGEDLDEAARLASRAASGYLRGDARLAGDTSGVMTEMMLPSAFRTAAEIA